MDLTVDIVREWLMANKAEAGVVTLLKDLGRPELTVETVGPWLETDEGKRLIQPIIDKRVTDGVKTHDLKTREANAAELKRQVEEAIAKANPKETAQDKEIRELRERVNRSEQAVKERELRIALSGKAREKGVDAILPGDYLPTDLEAAEKEMDRISAAVEARINKAKNELLAGAHKPGSGSNGSTVKPDLKNLSLADALKLEMEGKLNEALSAK